MALKQHPDTVLFLFEGYEYLSYPAHHPFRPERANLLRDLLEREGLLDKPFLSVRNARPAGRRDIEMFHAPDYLEALERGSRGEFFEQLVHFGMGGDDCPVFPGMYELAALAAGASLEGAGLIASKKADLVFNPLGGFHHAGVSHAEGFCYVNDVVLACLDFARRGLRVACVDLDVHHGNGTEDAFLDRDDVLTVSVHESGRTLYPWRGEESAVGVGAGRGFNINVPLPAGCDDGMFLETMRKIVMPSVELFRPDVVVLEIGMDVLQGDPLAHLRMTNNSVAEACDDIRELGLPILALGGGGYTPHDAARGWALSLLSLTNCHPADMFAGIVGGVFLGSNEHTGMLRDMQVFTSGPEREALKDEVRRLVAFHEQHTLPLITGAKSPPSK